MKCANCGMKTSTKGPFCLRKRCKNLQQAFDIAIQMHEQKQHCCGCIRIVPVGATLTMKQMFNLRRLARLEVVRQEFIFNDTACANLPYHAREAMQKKLLDMKETVSSIEKLIKFNGGIINE